MSSSWENHKKEAPVQGLQGLWGGASGALTGAGAAAPFSVFVTAGVQGFKGSDGGARTRSSGGNGLRTKNNNQGGSGGGFSGVWTNNTYSGNPMVMVGGGGGSDWQDQGGNGGAGASNSGSASDGGAGWDQHGGSAENAANARPSGGTLTAGGYYNYNNSASGCNGEPGYQLRGGDSTCDNSYAGGAGGGGYWGGGAGTGNVGNGGTPGSGGSGYLDTSTYTTQLVTGSTNAQRLQTYNPSGSTYYYGPNMPTSPGTYGGGGNSGSGVSGKDGLPGRVLIWDATFSSILHTVNGAASNTEVVLESGTQYGFELFGAGGAGGQADGSGGSGGYSKVKITMP